MRLPWNNMAAAVGHPEGWGRSRDSAYTEPAGGTCEQYLMPYAEEGRKL